MSMGTRDKSQGGKFELSRRDFLKAGAAATAAGVVGVGVDWAVHPPRADAVEPDAIYTTTCPYCSAQCGQKVAVKAGVVIDIYGDVNNPTSRGGLCSKGASAYQLVTNTRRLGVPEHTAAVDGFDFTGTAWRRVGNQSWQTITLAQAFDGIVNGATFTDPLGASFSHDGLADIRPAVTPGSTAASNAKTVQFFGCSHMNNEPNYLYRKIIANFGTSLVEHQARI
jgi:anaerobic selenocysteine-containing dehydrogenase